MEPSTSFSLLDVHNEDSSSSPPPIASIDTTTTTTTTTATMMDTTSNSNNKRPIISTTTTTSISMKGGPATTAVAVGTGTSYYDKGSVELAIETPVMLQRLEKRRKLTGTGANNTDGEFLLIVLVSYLLCRESVKKRPFSVIHFIQLTLPHPFFLLSCPPLLLGWFTGTW